MIDTSQDKFSAYFPIEIIEKGKKDENGLPEKLIISGVASDMNTGPDAQGEVLDVNGFDYSKFLESGFFNIDHLPARNKDFSAVVGEPTKAWVENGKFFVEGELYKDNPKAVAIYQLANTLKKAGSSRTVGYSIEGNALARDPKNPKLVTKASIEHMAITLSPRCNGTSLLIKGGANEFEYETLPDSELLIDVTDESGVRYTVDKTFNIQKSATIINTQSSCTAAEMDRVTQTESILGAKKKKKKKNIKDFFDNSDKSISKAEFVYQILSNFNIEPSLVKSIYDLVIKVQHTTNPMSENFEITPEAIKKAMEILSLVKAEEAPKEDESEKEEENEAKDEKKEEKVEKSAEETIREEYEAVLLKAKKAGVTLVEEKVIESIQKSEDNQIFKSLEEKINALGSIVTLKDKENEDLRKSITKATDFINQLSERVNKVENTPNGRKAVSTQQFAERFAKSENVDGIQTLSISNPKHKDQILSAIIEKSVEGGEIKDEQLFKSAEFIGYANSLWDSEKGIELISNRLKNELKINVIN